jgi:branched-chain amino acid transport system substrate-binding protein
LKEPFFISLSHLCANWFTMHTVGLLTPRSSHYPTLGTDWVQGIRTFLKEAGLTESVRLLSENIGFGTEESVIYASAEKMILQEDAGLVFLFGEPRLADLLSPLFTASGKLLVVVSMGANFPDNWEAAPTSLHLNLGFSFLTFLTGKKASRAVCKEAVNLISYYDGGYRQCFTLLQQHQAGGGVPVFNYVTSLRAEDFTLDPVGEFLKNHSGTRNILCLASGPEAGDFAKGLAPLQEAYDLSVWAGPMLLSEIPGLNPADQAARLGGYIPWHIGLPVAANQRFVNTMTGEGKAANYFSLLGWECGQLLEFFYRMNSPALNRDKVIELERSSLDTPRGTLRLDPRTHFFRSPVYFANRQADGRLEVEEGLESPEEDWQAFTQLHLAPGESSSWRNTYLCI